MTEGKKTPALFSALSGRHISKHYREMIEKTVFFHCLLFSEEQQGFFRNLMICIQLMADEHNCALCLDFNLREGSSAGTVRRQRGHVHNG